MIKSTKILAAILTIFLLSSFTKKDATSVAGTYGVSSSDHGKITLILNADHTFYYQDFSIAENEIAIKGEWTWKGQKVILYDKSAGIKFHNVWSFVENGQVAKSRKGLSFYRLCKMDG